MRMIFYPAAIPGWTLLGVWITTLRIRLTLLRERFEN
jgi:heme exporter protein C